MENNTARVLDDISALVPMGGVTIPGAHTKTVDFEGLYKRRDFFVERAQEAGLQVIEMKEDAENPCPFIIITFPEMIREGKLLAKVALVGHIDVVDGKPDLFEAKIDGDYIRGRGTTDMLGVDATFLEWMCDRQKKGGKKAPFVLMLSAIEEDDSKFGHNTYTAKDFLEKEYGADLEFAVVGERTGEMKIIDQPVESTIRDSNYGLRRYNVGGNLENPNASEVERALKVFSQDTVSALRTALEQANKRDGTHTTFANPFFEFDAGKVYTGGNFGDCINYYVPEGDSGKHSAQSQPSEVTPLESAIDYVNSLRGRFPHLRIQKIRVGNFNNFNRVSAGIDMDLVLGGAMSIPNRGIRVGPQERALVTPTGHPRLSESTKIDFGLEIREAPEHSAMVERLLYGVNRALKDIGAPLKVNTVRSGWTCDPKNPHLAHLRAAFQTVTGRTPEPEVKVFFNDGAAFVHECDQHPGSRSPVSRAAIFGQTGFAPHGDLERHYIPSIETGWRELDAFADQYLDE